MRRPSTCVEGIITVGVALAALCLGVFGHDLPRANVPRHGLALRLKP